MIGQEMEHKWLRNFWLDEYLPQLKPGLSLHPWQRTGVTFLHFCNQNFGYALLADTMGVGKVSIFLSFTQA